MNEDYQIPDDVAKKLSETETGPENIISPSWYDSPQFDLKDIQRIVARSNALQGPSRLRVFQLWPL